MLDLIIEPMQYGFIHRALLVSSARSSCCAASPSWVTPLPIRR